MKAVALVLSILCALTVFHPESGWSQSSQGITHVWSGTDDLVSETFSIATSDWTISWMLDGEPSASLTVVVRDGQGVPVVPPILQNGPGEGSRTLKTGPGRYYLEVDPDESSWLIRAKEETRQDVAPTAPRADRTPRAELQESSDSEVQACTGRGSRGGQALMSFGAAFSENTTAYVLRTGYDSKGPVTVVFNGNFQDIDDSDVDGYGAGGGILFEIPGLAASLCPQTSISYSTIEDVDLDLWTGSLGLAVGKGISIGPGVYLNPFASPNLIILHGRGFDESETETEFGLSVGLGISGTNMYGGFAVNITSVEDSDPTFGVEAGFMF